MKPQLLTAREAQILDLFGPCRRYRDVAAELNISLDTVRSHVRKAYFKLGVQCRADAVAKWAHIKRATRQNISRSPTVRAA